MIRRSLFGLELASPPYIHICADYGKHQDARKRRLCRFETQDISHLTAARVEGFELGDLQLGGVQRYLLHRARLAQSRRCGCEGDDQRSRGRRVPPDDNDCRHSGSGAKVGAAYSAVPAAVGAGSELGGLL